MCLDLTKDSKRLTRNLKEKKEPVIAYKILDSDMTSGYKHFQWKVGLNISDRKLTRLTKEELEDSEISKGFHLALDKPEKCPHQCRSAPQSLYQCQYRDHYLCLSRYQYQCLDQRTKIFKCKIDPKDIVSTGIWEGIPSLFATKVTLLGEVEYD